FSYKGYTFYQSGYNPDDLSYTAFQVVKDPGVPVVYAGFALMIVGLFIVFYLNPWLDARRKAS
ncbi:MAG TPA: cytochrome c biogenesis protein ResB, partial [Verrucomicrobiae bacterium]|nr:cytochrome c biogenesis protein ResB [Verrucomicrobiae bacterium]